MRKEVIRTATPTGSNYYTTITLAAHLSVHRNTVARMIADQKITATKIGREWRITPEAVAAYKASRTIKADGQCA